MKLHTALFAAVMLAGCGSQPGDTETKQAKSAQDMPMSSAERERTQDSAMDAAPQTSAAKSASATGTVESIDPASGKVTIAHGPVASLEWPAMTMGFKATPQQLASVKTGEEVQFEFEATGMDATLTRIAQTR